MRKIIACGVSFLTFGASHASAGFYLVTGADSITQSSTLGGDPQYAASKAIDGSFTTFTHSNGTADTTPSLTYNLPGGDLELDHLVIYNRGDGCCQDRLRDITVTVRNAADTATVFTSPLLNENNTAYAGATPFGPPSISVDLTGITGGIVIVSRKADVNGNVIGGNNAPGEDANGAYVLSIGELQVFAVPEPTSVALMGLAGAGLLARRRRTV